MMLFDLINQFYKVMAADDVAA